MPQSHTFPSFQDKLIYYLETLDVTYAELSLVSGLSVSTLSRYRNGERLPSPEGDHVKNLARGLARIAAEKGFPWDEETVFYSLTDTLNDGLRVPYKVYAMNLRTLLSALSVKSVTLARTLAYDPSHVSRILAGSRRPTGLSAFTREVAEYIAGRAAAEKPLYNALTEFLSISGAKKNPAFLAEEIVRYLLTHRPSEDMNALGGLLYRLSNFDLSDFTRSLSFEGVPLPEGAPRFRSSRSYCGIEEMKRGELDFLQMTLLSRTTEDVVAYSDMPMVSMASDPVFAKQWMLLLSMLLKKGHRLRILHDLDRPLQEILLGLESYVPLYMTGRVSSYCLPSVEGGVFHHHFRVSGTAALEGSAPVGDLESGKYVLYKSHQELLRCRKTGEVLLSRAKPMVDMFLSDRKRDFLVFARDFLEKNRSYRMVGDRMPLPTMSEKTLERILKRISLPPAKEAELRRVWRGSRILLEQNLSHTELEWTLFIREQGEDFTADPSAIPIAPLFPETDIFYTGEEYFLHLEDTRAYAAAHPHLKIRFERVPSFRNLSYIVSGDDEVIVVKGKAPAANFVIRHPAIANAFRHYSPPLTDD